MYVHCFNWSLIGNVWKPSHSNEDALHQIRAKFYQPFCIKNKVKSLISQSFLSSRLLISSHFFHFKLFVTSPVISVSFSLTPHKIFPSHLKLMGTNSYWKNAWKYFGYVSLNDKNEMDLMHNTLRELFLNLFLMTKIKFDFRSWRQMDLYAIYKPKNIDDILLQTKILLLLPIVFVCEASQSCFSVMVAKNDFFFLSICPSLMLQDSECLWHHACLGSHMPLKLIWFDAQKVRVTDCQRD